MIAGFYLALGRDEKGLEIRQIMTRHENALALNVRGNGFGRGRVAKGLAMRLIEQGQRGQVGLARIQLEKRGRRTVNDCRGSLGQRPKVLFRRERSLMIGLGSGKMLE